MELMLAHPEMSQNEIAERLNLTPSRLSIIVNTQLFRLAFEQFRNRYQEVLHNKVADLTIDAAEATRVALQTSVEIMQDKASPVIIRQSSVKDILDLGHAKAIEKKAQLNANMDVSADALKALGELAASLAIPFTPTHFLTTKETTDEETSEASAVSAS